MKKLFALSVCVLLVFALASCGDDPCSHRDADDNSLCDNCGESYTDGKDLPDEHKHDYTVKNTDSKYLDKAADCENAATYFYSCSCGAVGSETFAEGVPNDEHNVDGSGYCTICGTPFAPTEGIIYNLSVDQTYAEVVGYSGDYEKVIIASEYNGVPVKTIYDGSFYNKSITSVLVPDSVTSIGEGAFYNCSSLTSVTIPDSVTSIGSDAFNACNSELYTEYNYGKYVGDSENQYSALIELTNKYFATYDINEDTKIIAANVFEGCARLSSIVIPASVTSIGEGSFYNCYSLTSVMIPDSVVSIGSSAFRECDSLTSVTIGDSVESIGSYAFCGCDSLTSVTIGDSVESIGYKAFTSCYSLTSVYIADVAKWCGISFGSSDSNPLYYAHNLYLNGELVTELVIPDSVTSIGDYAFCGCRSLTSVTIGDSVESIGERAFRYCRSLTSVTIPDSVVSIGSEAFSSCGKLTDIYFAGSEEEWGTIVGNNAFESHITIHFDYVSG